MPTPWHDSIKKTGQLTIFPKPSVTSGAWGVVFTDALAEFNALSSKRSLGVTFVETKDPPNEDEYTGTNFSSRRAQLLLNDVRRSCWATGPSHNVHLRVERGLNRVVRSRAQVSAL